MKRSLLASLFLTPLLASAAIELPDIVGDNMVLQQQSDAKIWGWATPGSKISATTSWSKGKSTATTDDSGRWEMRLATGQAGYTPQTITLKGDGSEITLNNVVIGEVWFCSGQSNMEMPLRGFWTQPVEGSAQAIAYSGKYPGIRMATVPKRAAYTPQDRVEGKWKVSNPANSRDFSAMAYFFARSLNDILDVPVGIICCAYGGSKVEGWEPKELLDGYPEWDVEKEKNDTTLQEWERINVMYNAMLHPLIGYTIKGFLWNQGESNVGRHDTYPAHFRDMVACWRNAWGDQNLPIYQVEIPGWNYDNPEGTNAAMFRECQHKAAAITPNCGIVCTADLVYPYELEDIHASRKREIGERLAWMASARTYNIEGMPVEYPAYESMEVDGNKATIHLSNAWSGVTPNDVLEGFEVADADRVFYPAEATEDPSNATIKLTCDKVSKIVAVRYNFKNFAIGKVFGINGLPLIPFRTDNWDDNTSISAPQYVTVKNGEFYVGDSIYRYVGTNFWYGAILASTGRGGDRARLTKELDLLQECGIDNLRILAGGDGEENIPSHIMPVLQTAPGVYNDTILDGLDYLMAELEKRNMKAVIFLNNAWEWSGGYGTYLEWAGAGDTPNPAIAGYDAYMRHVAGFVKNEKAKELADNHVRYMVSRTNRYTGKPYSESPALMTWEIANEPRAFADDSVTKAAFADWIGHTAKLIKSIDHNHLVSTGSEGKHGCEQDLALWTTVHSFPEIDYGIIHLWPYNWSWISESTIVDNVDYACQKTEEYIRPHYEAMSRIGKPLVLEEFGYPRDGFVYTPGTPTVGRDRFYEYVFSMIANSGMIAGCNFWGWGGYATPAHENWQPWDEYVCDPAQEAQGLNSVFAKDTTTLDIIRKMTKKIVTKN